MLILVDDLIDILGFMFVFFMIFVIGRECMFFLVVIIFGILVIFLKKFDVVEELFFDMEDSFLEEVKLGLVFVKMFRFVLIFFLIFGGL